MDMVRPWLAALVLSMGLQVAYVMLIFPDVAPLAELDQPSGQVLFLALPSFLVNVVAGAVAALVHRAPERERRGRNALAAVGVLVVLWVIGIVRSVGHATVFLLVTSTAAQLLGAVLGWLLVLLVKLLRDSGREVSYY